MKIRSARGVRSVCSLPFLGYGTRALHRTIELRPASEAHISVADGVVFTCGKAGAEGQSQQARRKKPNALAKEQDSTAAKSTP